MNAILKKILSTAKDIAEVSVSTTIPGSGLVISGAEKLFDKDKSNNLDGVIDINDGVITALESLKCQDVADEVLLSKGIADAKIAFDEIKKAIKK